MISISIRPMTQTHSVSNAAIPSTVSAKSLTYKVEGFSLLVLGRIIDQDQFKFGKIHLRKLMKFRVIVMQLSECEFHLIIRHFSLQDAMVHSLFMISKIIPPVELRLNESSKVFRS